MMWFHHIRSRFSKIVYNSFHTRPRVGFRNVCVSDLNIKFDRLDRMSVSDNTSNALEKIGLTSIIFWNKNRESIH